MLDRMGIRFVVAPPGTPSLPLLTDPLGLRPIEKGRVEIYQRVRDSTSGVARDR